MRFLRKIKDVTMFDKYRNSAIRQSVKIESLLLRIERSHLQCFGHVSQMPQERLSKQTLCVEVSGKKPVGRPQTRWLDNAKGICWYCFDPSEMQSVLVNREVWWLNLELLRTQPSRKSG